LLAQSVVREYGGKVRFVVENYGQSELAKRYGVTRYPAIFVDDVLAATPSDFGFYGRAEGKDGGRYAPLQSLASHERFRSDLEKMVELTLAGKKAEARAHAAHETDGGVASYPEVAFDDIDGNAVTREGLAGKVTVVEFWATWCPPCPGTLKWLAGLQRQYGNRLEVIAIAVESDSARVRALRRELGASYHFVLGSSSLVRKFGDVSATPTMYLFDRRGRAAATFFGAPPTLHAAGESKVAELVGKSGDGR
jgi:thiol-disulfide isomerase/thioredoxin